MFREFIFSRGAEHVTLPIEYKFEFKSKGNGENEKRNRNVCLTRARVYATITMPCS
ncbi:hypothetical protein M5D96_013396 [Drosophila gunungcola]|uniref:Uncharacterized protein n=1 Tax=Drosophila gunungcola TaxID=103775 RepID=A0A9P9YC65_9MUSC|nr:hypothetical protein M5D96_014091 [Drosophila gunungcola]KAI8033848.1 hypothetical protein M5D96_013396 [Drosophila gunungcola]